MLRQPAGQGAREGLGGVNMKNDCRVRRHMTGPRLGMIVQDADTHCGYVFYLMRPIGPLDTALAWGSLSAG